jgi:hypothetical protein
MQNAKCKKSWQIEKQFAFFNGQGFLGTDLISILDLMA